MKSQVHAIHQVAEGIIADVLQAYPTIRGLDRDTQRLASLVEDRGLGLFSLDLPHLDKVLLQGLSLGQLILEGPLTRPYSKKIRVPRLFAGLWLRVFDSSGVILTSPDETAIFMLRQIFCLGKKIETPCAPARFNQTIQEYISIEESTRTPTYNWSGSEDLLWEGRPTVSFRDSLADFEFSCPRPGITPEQRLDRLNGSVARLERISARISSGLGFLDPQTFSEELWDRGDRPGVRHGPGAVADRRSREYKFEGFPYWPAKLQKVFPFDAFGVANPSVILEDDFEYPSSDLHPSTLYAVPKTAKGPRLIAAEPTANQWCQQMLLTWLLERLDCIFGDDFITIKDQGPSRRMAMSASVRGELATVDLSSASDRLSCWAVERFFRSNLTVLEAFHAVRSESVHIPYPGFEQTLLLKKFATQGSALTFPVQSILFLGCALASSGEDMTLLDYRHKYKGSVRVFGDDIIVPRHWYADLVDLLHYLGLKVNLDKSFSSGIFRESCGIDAVNGCNVTPTKPRSLRSDGPTSITSLIDTANNLWLSGLWNASKAVESMIPTWVTRLLPLGLKALAVDNIGVGTPTLASFSGYTLSHLAKRRNSSIFVDEVRTLRITSRARRKDVGGTGRLLQYFTERPDFSNPTEWEGGMSTRPRLTMRSGWEPIRTLSPSR